MEGGMALDFDLEMAYKVSKGECVVGISLTWTTSVSFDERRN